MWELSLEPRCIAFGRQPQAALVPGFLVTRSDICASPLPAGLPTSCCSSLRSKARSRNTFCSGFLWKARSEGPVTDTMEMKHSCFIFQFYPDSTWDWIQTGFIVFWQYDTSSHFKLMLSPTLCDCSVTQLSDLAQRVLFTSPLLAFSSVDFYSTCIPHGQSTIFREKLLCLGYRAAPRREFRTA